MSLITTKGADGLMAVFEVSKGTSEHPVSINAISANIGVSRNYLEQILNALKKAGIISALKGMKGGYYLSKNLSEISFGEVLDTLENDFGFFAKDIEGEYKELFGTLDKELKKLMAPIGNSSLPIGRSDALVSTDKAVADKLGIQYVC